MPTARSRLSRSRRQRGSRAARTASHLITALTPLAKRYLKFSPTLLPAMLSWGAVGYILTSLPPANIEHWLLPHSYLPLLLPLFLAFFFTASFLLLHSRRGLLAAVAIIVPIWLQLHGVALTSSPILTVAAFCLLLELAMTGVERVAPLQ
jgi:hypothetical protein